MNHLHKLLRNRKTYVLVNNNLGGKLFSSLESPTTFDKNFKVTLVPFFIPDFNYLVGNYAVLRFSDIILKEYKITILS